MCWSLGRALESQSPVTHRWSVSSGVSSLGQFSQIYGPGGKRNEWKGWVDILDTGQHRFYHWGKPCLCSNQGLAATVESRLVGQVYERSQKSVNLCIIS